MKLIAELTEAVSYVVEEAADGRKKLFIEGTYLQSGVKNRNGRIYPPPLLEREVDRYVQEKVRNGNAFGELGHPSGPGLNMERISHIVTELKKSGNDYVGKARIIDEGYGKIARGIIEAEGKLGVSSRGMGTLKEDKKMGAMIVQNDFKLHVAADIVADPSAPGAWVNGVMENVDWVLDEKGEWTCRALEQVRETVRAAPKSELDAAKMRAFEEFLWSMTEETIVNDLARTAGVDAQHAQSAVSRARVRAKITGQQSDPSFVRRAARDILGLGGR